MKPLAPALSDILGQARSDYVLMCDFDGTLAPIVADPEKAHMTPHTRAALKACAKHMQVVIISGRALSDIRKRVGIPGVWYVGNHGLEWRFGRRGGHIRLTQDKERTLSATRLALDKIVSRYPGSIMEDKIFTLSVHFRAVPAARRGAFKRAVQKAAAPFRSKGISSSEGREYVYNVRPKAGFDKGWAARFALAHVKGKSLPIFIGDDETDEDAFRALKHKRGITISVGKRSKSAAKYYVPKREGVDAALVAFAKAVAQADVRRR
ncbi:MAG: trehalose-phosphatase [Patescibacteria group bacterium]|nr:trehalose-phosphatase [Patescibacteria group bacterium]